MKRSTKVLLLTAAFYVVGAGPAYAGLATAEPTEPDGIGGLFDIPDLAKGQGPTLLEDTSLGDYTLHVDVGFTNVADKTAALIYGPLSVFGLALVRLAIGLTWWLNTLTNQDVGVGQLGSALQDVATELNVWLLPTALAIGAVIAFGRSRAGEDALGQVGWVLGMGIASVALALSGQAIIGGVDDARQLVARTVSAVGPVTDQAQARPFEWPGTDLESGNQLTDLNRSSGDMVWRAFAVVPWCQAQFGSQEACERYGAQWLALGNDEDDRKDFIEDTVVPAEGGSDSSTVEFMKGNNPADRIAVGIFTIIVGLGAVVVIGGLALLALMPWVTALLLMFALTLFLCLLVVPGRLRQLGLDMLNIVGGLVLLSALSTAVLTGALLAVTAFSSVTSVSGWLPTSILTVAILLAAWQARGLLERVLFVTGQGGGRLSGLGAALGINAIRRLSGGSRSRSSTSSRSGAPVKSSPAEASGAGGPGLAGRRFSQHERRPDARRTHGTRDMVDGRRADGGNVRSPRMAQQRAERARQVADRQYRTRPRSTSDAGGSSSSTRSGDVAKKPRTSRPTNFRSYPRKPRPKGKE